MDEEDYSSDTSDDDYVPTENVDVSEEDESGDEEDLPQDDEHASNIRGTKRRRGKSKKGKKDESVRDVDKIETETNSKQEEDEKAKSDRLWADFMKDIPSSRPSKTSTSNTDNTVNKESKASAPCEKAPIETKEKPKEVLVTKEYKFAGETVRVTEAVSVNSKEAIKNSSSPLLPSTTDSTSSPSTVLSAGVKRSGGLAGVLNKIDKKPKMSTLVKSKLDWDTFKSKEGIEEDLKIHNRGKSGYLERKAFLDRTDLRQFEIEKSLRLSSQRKPT